MITKMIEGCTRILGKSQGYIGLPVRDQVINCGVSDSGTPAVEMVTAWEPTPNELAALNAGGTVYLSVLGTAHPPVKIWAEGPPLTTVAADASCSKVVDATEVREQAALLIEGMISDPEYAKRPDSRMALAIAARNVRRGRKLTPSEQMANLAKATQEVDGDDPGIPTPSSKPQG